MRRFLTRIFLFSAIPVSLAAAWLAFVVVLDRTLYVRSLSMPPDADSLVCGDSQTKDALDPAAIPGLFNFSNAASSHDQNLFRLEDLLGANPGRVRKVFVDVSPLKLGYDPSVPVSALSAARVHFLVHVYHWRDRRRPFGAFHSLVRDVLFTRKFNELRKTLLRGGRLASPLSGGFSPVGTHGFLNPRYRERALADVAAKAERIDSLPPATGEEPLFAAVRDELRLARSRGAEPVLTTMPLSPALLAAVDPARLDAFTRAARRLAGEEGVEYIDFLRHPTDEGDWHDANHMNRDGAAKFSPVFAARRSSYSRSPVANGVRDLIQSSPTQ